MAIDSVNSSLVARPLRKSGAAFGDSQVSFGRERESGDFRAEDVSE
jgi:hypothetical protein